ncbi:tyrosine-type recombinase/integrase [Paracoccus tibetensis]|uniref:Site-specific recombinase XerD n=1 Tax=Paracoccus tibetensis TaxID=336292 RepID=A0A1G5BC76_9RHOB|nr:tyrosine-type recombinase/integrase [Paracoccus tibetensis]SCX87650.1 Site-specific recombinase XerD [Paracoccus tibetensis]
MAGKSSKGANRLLLLSRNVWWFRQQVPAAVRKVIAGPQFIMVNLHTADVIEAKKRRDELEAQTAMQFRQIKMGRRTTLELPGWKPSGPRKAATLGPSERGAIWRETLAAYEDADDDEALSFARSVAEDEADQLRNDTQRRAFADALTGREEVAHHLDTYLSTAGLAPKTTEERRGLVMRFARWATDKGLTLDRIDRRQAGKYVGEVIDPMHPVTQKKHLTSLRSYWKHLARRGHIDLPPGMPLDDGWPWNGQQTVKTGKRVERGSKKEEERAFTDEEVKKLLYSPWPMKRPEWESQIRDALIISLLSGMRLAEVLTLWVEDVHDGVFDIQQGKTEAAARKVPIHPDLEEIVKRRVAGKTGKDWLFHGLKTERDPGDTFGKRFKRFREGVGVDDKREGTRRSLVNFHSARRWFTTKARHAGHPRETIAEIVGHAADKKDVTFGVYAKGASEVQRRACVGDVKLPVRE